MDANSNTGLQYFDLFFVYFIGVTRYMISRYIDLREKKNQWSKLKTRLTRSFSRFIMVSFVNKSDEVNIS
jgi:hypothetical protein